MELPTGTVTFLFTDIEGSTRLLQEMGDRFGELIEAHARLMRNAIATSGGVEVRTEGDAFFVAFDSAVGAVAAACRAQQALASHDWPSERSVRVRMGLHTGSGVLGGDDYIGLDVHRAARIAACGHGGQIVVSEATARLVERMLPDGVSMRDLGAHRLKDIPHAEHLHQVDIDGLPSSFPPLRTLEAPSRLPTTLSEFVGREREITQAIDLLASTRLLTITGPGGAGKTRLAIRIAERIQDRFAGGTYFVALEEITDASRLLGVVADTVGAPPSKHRSPLERLESLVGSLPVLLVLDNLEQVSDPAPVVGELLRACPGVAVLASSRIPLRVSGEQEMAVPPMSVPRGGETTPQALLGHDAIDLFVRRAVAVRPEFELSEDNATAVRDLCVRLDGLPLAIEIAAARVRLLTPAMILERLDAILDTRGSRDLPERQQTLRDAIAWSHDLLEPPVRRSFDRLAVFAGGAWLEDLEAFAAATDSTLDPLDAIGQLVDHSLLSQSVSLGAPRFHMLETIRSFAAHRLEEAGDTDAVRAVHADVYLGLAERSSEELLGPRRVEWLERLALDRFNIEGALDWAIESGSTEHAQRIVSALWRFWQMRGHLSEAVPKIDAVLAMEGPMTEQRARALESAGGVFYWLGDLERTRTHYEEALAFWRDAGDQFEIAHALHNLAYPLGFADGPDAAIPALREAASRYEAVGDGLGLGRVHRMLGLMEAQRGDREAWASHARKSLEYFDEAEHPFDVGWARFSVAGSAFVLGDVDGSEDALQRGLELFRGVGDVSSLLLYLGGFVEVSLARGRDRRAARLAGAMARVREETGATEIASSIANRWLNTEAYEELERRWPADFAAGRALLTHEAIELALERPEEVDGGAG